MANYYQKNEDVDIVLGQIAKGKYGDWQPIYTHKEIQKLEKVTLAQCPDMMQSIGPGGKMFSARFADLRFDEDVVFCEEHRFIIKAYQEARNIQLLPNMVYGYNEVEGSVTHQRAEQFEAYMLDALKVRTRVMDILSSNDERTYYSYRMDNLIVSYLLQAYIEKNNVITEKLLNTVSMYIKTMQKTDYSGDAMFRIVKVVEQGSKKWSKPLYQQWREVLHSVGIGRPNYYRFKVEVLPKRAKLRGKMKLKHYLKR